MERLTRSAVSGSHGHLGERLVEHLEQSSHQVIRLPRNGIVPECDYVFDLAAYGNISSQLVNFQEIYQANLTRLIDSVRSSESYDYKAFIFVSSSSVLLPHQTYYSASKSAAEEFLQIYHREMGKPVVAVRPSTVTGVGESDVRLIPKLIHSCLTGESMDFVLDPTHDFIDVDDFVRGIVFVSKNIDSLKGKVLNISSGQIYTNDEVRKIVEKVTGKTANVNVVTKMRSYDTPRWEVDNSEIVNLGWEPTKTLEQSIVEMVKNYE